jgi:hypothetical protein
MFFIILTNKRLVHYIGLDIIDINRAIAVFPGSMPLLDMSSTSRSIILGFFFIYISKFKVKRGISDFRKETLIG